MTLKASASVAGLSSFVCLAFLTLSLCLLYPFYLDYVLLFPVFAPAPLDIKFSRQLLEPLLCLEYEGAASYF